MSNDLATPKTDKNKRQPQKVMTTPDPQAPGEAGPPRMRASSSPDDPVRDGVQLGLVAFTTFAALIGLLVIGAVAERMGIDPWLGTGVLARPISETFATGAELPLVMLKSLYGSGVADPLFFGASLALAIPPIAGLVAARPRRRGAERPSPAVAAASGLTAALVVGADILLGVWASNRTPSTLADAISDPTWSDSLRDTAAADCVAMILAILLAILILRLPTERWVRGLCGTIAIASAVAAVGLASASAGVVTMIERDFPVVGVDAPDSKLLLVGTRVDGRTVALSIEDQTMTIISTNALDQAVTGHGSIAEIIDSRIP